MKLWPLDYGWCPGDSLPRITCRVRARALTRDHGENGWQRGLRRPATVIDHQLQRQLAYESHKSFSFNCRRERKKRNCASITIYQPLHTWKKQTYKMSIQLRDGLQNQPLDKALEDLLVRFVVNSPAESLTTSEVSLFHHMSQSLRLNWANQLRALYLSLTTSH